MQSSSPFGNLFHVYSSAPLSHAETVNSAAMYEFCDVLSQHLPSPGHSILFSSPRAGFGKTHLLSILQRQYSATHDFILLRPEEGNRLDSETVISDVISHLSRPFPGGGGLTGLDFLTRRIFALGLEPLVRSGELPCQDRDQALHSFAYRPVETFDFYHPAAATAHWVRKNIEVLRHRLAEEISIMINAPAHAVGFWINALFAYAIKQPDSSSRKLEIMQELSAAAKPNSPFELLTTLLKILSLTHRVVLVADDLEAFSTNQDSALQLVSFLTSLRSIVERMTVILAVNDDIWENAFLPKITDGLLDRISEVAIRLEPLTREQAIDLLSSRHVVAGNFINQIRTDEVLYARALLRHAAAIWPSYCAGNAVTGPDQPDENSSDQWINEQTPQITPEAHGSAVEMPPSPAAVDAASVPYPSVFSAEPIIESKTMAASSETGSPLSENIPSHISTADLDQHESPFFIQPTTSAVQDFTNIPFSKTENHALVAAADLSLTADAANHQSERQREEDRINDLLKRFRERYQQSH